MHINSFPGEKSIILFKLFFVHNSSLVAFYCYILKDTKMQQHM